MSKSLSFPSAALLGALILSQSCKSVGTRHQVEAETATRDYEAIDPTLLPASSEKLSFTRHVKPVLEAKCVACHSGVAAAGGYRLDEKKLAFTTGYRGARIAPSHPGQSLMLDVAGTHRNVAVMPPVGNRLTEQKAGSWSAGSKRALPGPKVPGASCELPELTRRPINRLQSWQSKNHMPSQRRSCQARHGVTGIPPSTDESRPQCSQGTSIHTSYENTVRHRLF